MKNKIKKKKLKKNKKKNERVKLGNYSETKKT